MSNHQYCDRCVKPTEGMHQVPEWSAEVCSTCLRDYQNGEPFCDDPYCCGSDDE